MLLLVYASPAFGGVGVGGYCVLGLSWGADMLAECCGGGPELGGFGRDQS